MRLWALLCLSLALARTGMAQGLVPLSAAPAPSPATAPSGTQLPLAQLPSQTLLGVRKIYVGPLAGGLGAGPLRELIIASLDGTRLFTLTDNADRADAILKGAADDHVFTNSFDSDSSISNRTDLGLTAQELVAATSQAADTAGRPRQTGRRTTCENANTRPMRASGCATGLVMLSGRLRRRAWVESSAERAPMWR